MLSRNDDIITGHPAFRQDPAELERLKEFLTEHEATDSEGCCAAFEFTPGGRKEHIFGSLFIGLGVMTMAANNVSGARQRLVKASAALNSEITYEKAVAACPAAWELLTGAAGGVPSPCSAC